MIINQITKQDILSIYFHFVYHVCQTRKEAEILTESMTSTSLMLGVGYTFGPKVWTCLYKANKHTPTKLEATKQFCGGLTS